MPGYHLFFVIINFTVQHFRFILKVHFEIMFASAKDDAMYGVQCRTTVKLLMHVKMDNLVKYDIDY